MCWNKVNKWYFFQKADSLILRKYVSERWVDVSKKNVLVLLLLFLMLPSGFGLADETESTSQGGVGFYRYLGGAVRDGQDKCSSEISRYECTWIGGVSEYDSIEDGYFFSKDRGEKVYSSHPQFNWWDDSAFRDCLWKNKEEQDI